MAQQNRQGAPLREKTPRTCSNPFRMVTSKSPTSENCEGDDVTCVSLLDLLTIYFEYGEFKLQCSSRRCSRWGRPLSWPWRSHIVLLSRCRRNRPAQFPGRVNRPCHSFGHAFRCALQSCCLPCLDNCRVAPEEFALIFRRLLCTRLFGRIVPTVCNRGNIIFRIR